VKLGRYSRATAAVCLVTAGCLPYAYPKLSYIPGGDLGPKADDAHAFRVDVVANRTANPALMPCDAHEYTLAEITPRPDGSIPPQARVTVDRGFLLPTTGFAVNPGRVHETRVRLYRPGYQLVELGSWDSTSRIEWRPALDWKAQEQAITDLLACPQLTPTFSGSALRNRLPPQPTSPEETRALVFAAGECERVAALAPTPADAARLKKKAQDLREAATTAKKEGAP
jgi:hypothetical protein